jgi:O-antigen ligase
MKKKDALLYGFSLLFFISLFLSRFVTVYVIAMGVLVVVSFGYSPFQEKIQLLKSRKHIWFKLGFAGMLIASFLFSENRHAGIRALELRAPLLVFPLSIGLLNLTKEFRNKILLGMGIIVCAACFASLCWAFYRFRQENNNSAWLYNDALSYLIGQQSIYTSVFVNISIYVFTYYLLYEPLSARRKFLLGSGIVFLFAISYLLASRNMMLILYATVIVFSFYVVLKKKKYVEGATLLMGLFIAGFLIYKFFPKTLNRFKELGFTQFSYQNEGKESHYAGELTADQWNGANFRLAVWPCGWQLFKENPVIGVGLGDKKDKLFRIYEQKQFRFAITTRKNVHNNYLDILMSTGIIGFLLFCLGWVFLPLIQVFRNKDELGFLILFTLSLAMLTENYFDRSFGSIVFGFFVTFLLATGRKKFS